MEVQVRLWQQQSDSVKKKMSRSAPLLPLNSQAQVALQLLLSGNSWTVLSTVLSLFYINPAVFCTVGQLPTRISQDVSRESTTAAG